MSSTIEVRILGAVQHAGPHRLSFPAMLLSALEAAGGLAHKAQKWASGVVTVRRRQAAQQIQTWQFSVFDPAVVDWQQFELHDSDLVIVQWHVEELPSPAHDTHVA